MTQALGFTHWKSTALKKVSGCPALASRDETGAEAMSQER